VKCRIKEIYDENQGRYGYRRIALALRREGGALNHKVVQRLMNVLRLKAAIRVKRYSSWRGEHGRAADNILQRNFKASRPNENGSPMSLNSPSVAANSTFHPLLISSITK
jgi:putative transposase